MNLKDRLSDSPALFRLLESLSENAPETGRLYLAGGAVRDLLLGTPCPQDIDLVLTGSSPKAYGESLRRRLGAFGFRSDPSYRTARLEIPFDGKSFSLDINHTRRESYPTPGGLPSVAWIDSLYYDMERRDFSVNAMAISLNADSFGELIDYTGGQRDLGIKCMRVLHDRSFLDDPTRILRLFRYAARLDFSADAHTMDLLNEALDKKCLDTLSTDRLMHELLRCLSDSIAHKTLLALAGFGILFPDARGLAALHAFEEDGEIFWKKHLPGLDSVLVKILLLRDPSFLGYNMNRLYSNTLSHWIRHGEAWRQQIRSASTPGLLYDLLSPHAPEALVAMAQTGGDGSAEWVAAVRFLSVLKGTAPRLDGEDLLALGVPPGPAVGRFLSELLHLRLDGRIDDSREAEAAYVLKHLERKD